MVDEGHVLTESRLKALEKRVNGVYKNAQKELAKTSADYFDQFKTRDAEQYQRVLDGKITFKQYTDWRLNSIARGKRFEAMRDKMAERASDAYEVSLAYINDTTPGIYSLNRSFAAWQIEQAGTGVSFTMYDEATVRRLIVRTPDVMPYYPPERALQRGIDLDYGKKQITAQVTSSILQGKSIPQMADALQWRITNMSRVSAIRAARTATTAAQNGGRMDTYVAAEEMGIVMQKQWIATKDDRTRDSHANIDREMVNTDEPFSNGLMYPGDPSGPPAETYNCRCTMISVVNGFRPTGKTSRHASTTNPIIDTFTNWVKRKAKEAVSGTFKPND